MSMPETPELTQIPPRPIQEGREKASMEALLHGIFAITMTLLILELRVPESEDDGQLWHSLTDLGPEIAAYLFGFVYLMAVWLSMRDFFRQLNGISRAVSVVTLAVIGTVSLTPFTVSTMASSAGNDDFGVAVRLMAAVAATSFLLSVLGAKIALRQGLVPANRWFMTPWPSALLLSAGPAMLGFALSYLNPWLGIAVLSTDIVLGILDFGQSSEERTDPAPEGAELPASA